MSSLENFARQQALQRVFDEIGLPVPGSPGYAVKRLLGGIDIFAGGPVVRTVMDVEPATEAEPFGIAEPTAGTVRDGLTDVGLGLEKLFPGGYSPEAPGEGYGAPPLGQALPLGFELGLYSPVARGLGIFGMTTLDAATMGYLKRAKQVQKVVKQQSLTHAMTRQSPAVQKLYSIAPGALAGLDEDEHGQLTFDPEKAIIGIASAAAGTAIVSRIGITRRGRGGRYMRGRRRGKHPVLKMADNLDEAAIIPEWDTVTSVEEAKHYASRMKFLRPTVENNRYPLRYRNPDPQTGAFGNMKMKYPTEAYPEGRNTWEKVGCGRAEFAQANSLVGEHPVAGSAAQACYGGACYAEVPRYGRSSAKSSARVSTRLQPANGQDIRLGIDTDGSAWLAEKHVLDAIEQANPRTVTVYSSAFHKPPPPHTLSERAIVNVTVSGWHPLPETLKRLEWAEEARRNGWNVILREVTADPSTFTLAEASHYNRFHKALEKTDFFIMEQPLHRGSAYGKPLHYPGCCTSEKRLHTCDGCEVTEGLGKGFQRFWNIAEEPDEILLPAVPDYEPVRR